MNLTSEFWLFNKLNQAHNEATKISGLATRKGTVGKSTTAENHGPTAQITWDPAQIQSTEIVAWCMPIT